MGLRFHRSFRVFPGARLNVSRSGVSTSFGRRGAWFTIGPRGTRATMGLPGSGLSYTESARSGAGGGRIFLLIVLLAVLGLLLGLFP